MLSALREDGFFEKRDAIIEKARKCGYEQLWVIVPTFLTSLNLEVCHCLFDSLPEKTPSLENRNRFLEALSTTFGLKSTFILYSKNSIEETAILIPTTNNTMRARLNALIPMKKLLFDVPLEEQERMSIEFSSTDVINARLDSYEKELEETPEETLSDSAKPASLKMEEPTAAASFEKPLVISSTAQKNLFRDQQETSPTKRLRGAHDSDAPLSLEKKTQVNNSDQQEKNSVRH